MNSGLTAERVYDAIRAQILDRAYLPGTRLDPAQLAKELAASMTPVRDALHRLMGEGLVEARTGSGFHLPLLNEPSLIDLYRWSHELSLLALRHWTPEPSEPCRHRHWPIARTRFSTGLRGDRTMVSIVAPCSRLQRASMRSVKSNHMPCRARTRSLEAWKTGWIIPTGAAFSRLSALIIVGAPGLPAPYCAPSIAPSERAASNVERLRQ